MDAPIDTTAVYLIEWMDSVGGGNAAWVDLADAREAEPDVMRSVGYVVRQTRQFVTIAAHVSKHQGGIVEDQVAGLMVIPRRTIRSMKRLVARWPK